MSRAEMVYGNAWISRRLTQACALHFALGVAYPAHGIAIYSWIEWTTTHDGIQEWEIHLLDTEHQEHSITVAVDAGIWYQTDTSSEEGR